MIEFICYCLYAFLQGVIMARIFFRNKSDRVGMAIAFMLAAPIITVWILIALFLAVVNFFVNGEWS